MSTGVHNYKSIITLVVFLVANIIVVLPFHIHIPVPQLIQDSTRRLLAEARIVPSDGDWSNTRKRSFISFPLGFVTAPFIGVLLLLAIGTIGRKELHDGIVGSDGVHPIDVMALFISLAYISISLDATGLLRFLAFWVLKKGGSRGRLLYSLLYLLFFTAGVIVGNDPVILSGTAFLAYMTRVAGIDDPTAWIYAEFIVANIASAVLVSSNPTNLILAGAFQKSFIIYTANVIIPVLFTALVLFPFLLLVIFRSPELIPPSIDVHASEDDENDLRQALVDRAGAIFGCVLLAITLGTLLATSAAGANVGVYAITVPAAIIMLVRDIIHDWKQHSRTLGKRDEHTPSNGLDDPCPSTSVPLETKLQDTMTEEETALSQRPEAVRSRSHAPTTQHDYPPLSIPPTPPEHHKSLTSLIHTAIARLRTTFPTVSTISSRLPFPLLPFAFSMFILVQGLASNAWVEVFTSWWVSWMNATSNSILGAVGGMGFISVVFCNITGTNIGATILLARIIQSWAETEVVGNRTKEAAIYALALGSNYGAFSGVFSSSLAGLLWRDILRQKGVMVRQRDFIRWNTPIVAIAMAVGCSVLVGQIYIIKKDQVIDYH